MIQQQINKFKGVLDTYFEGKMPPIYVFFSNRDVNKIYPNLAMLRKEFGTTISKTNLNFWDSLKYKVLEEPTEPPINPPVNYLYTGDGKILTTENRLKLVVSKG